MSVSEKTTTAGAVKIRSLITSELPLLKDHLLRLSPASRRDRFNGFADDGFIARYCAKCAGDGTIVMAYFTEDGAVHAAAELHQPDPSTDSLPEVAFSVEETLRRRGVGSILFKKLIAVARSLGYERLKITTGSQNQAMRALAHKFGARLTFRQGESTGTIDLNGSVPNVDAPAHPGLDPAGTMIDLNQAFWKLMLKMSGIGRAA